MAETAPAQRAVQKQQTSTIATRAAVPRTTSRLSPIHRLMRAVGNSAAHRLLRSPIQAKLTVGPADDEYEREADRVADEVMRMPDPAADVLQRSPLVMQRMCADCEEEQLHRMCAECEEEQLQRHPVQSSSTPAEAPEVSPRLGSYLAATRGGGAPLSPASRAFFEPRFGREFGHVRVHTDEGAADASSEIRARAFTTGSDIYFARGQYSPGSSSGDRLLGHELTHVVQQGKDRSMTPLRRAPQTKREYSRGNDDQFECCYETAAITVGLELDSSKCKGNKKAKLPATVTYQAVLGGKTSEAGGSAPTQPTTEGVQHFLVEKGRPKNKVHLTLTSGNTLEGSIAVQNDTTCGGSKQDSGCVFVKGPREKKEITQQEIRWTAAGETAKSIEAVQRPQPKEAGTNRLKAGLPLLGKGGYPTFANAQPRHKDCWCQSGTGYHLNYSDGDKCPAQFRVNGGVDLPPELNLDETKPRKGAKMPPVCETPESTKSVCSG